MEDLNLKKLLLGTSLLTGFAMFGLATPAFAQSADEESIAVETVDADETEEVRKRDEVVVTGSRIKRDTFSSISPLQVIDTDFAADQGLFNPVEILQSSSAAGGQQIDSTFQGFVLDNGPGSETIDLRGLGASRTLVMINGRRMAPAGVEGAPSQPSINLIPRTLVDRYDLLTDGASSVYGSDAVAGVINIILKNDFDGLEVEAFADTPEQGDGQDYTLGATYGKTGDRGFIGVGAEYRFQEAWTTGDRDFLRNCETYREITADGEIRTVNISAVGDAAAQGLTIRTSECIPQRNTQRILLSGAGNAGNFGSLYYNPTYSGSNIPGYNFLSMFGTYPDADGDGAVDVISADFSPNGQQADQRELVNEQEQISLMAVGEYTMEGKMNFTPYFEAMHVNIKTDATGGQGQLFPFVPASNPFNPCNPAAAGGVDCGLAYDAVLNDPDFAARFASVQGLTPAQFRDLGIANIYSGATGALRVRPVIGVLNDRNNVKTDLDQNRIVIGARGDLPQINFGSFNNWSFDTSFTHSNSSGQAQRSGIREDRLNFGLGVDPNTGADLSAPCVAAPGSTVAPEVANGCVPLNLFAPSLMGVAAGGTFATQAETDYVFDIRDFDTSYAQTIFEGYMTGNIFSLPGGDVSLGLGGQIRHDEIDSKPDDIARDGLFFGFFNDAGAVGEKMTKEVYGELFIPLGTGKALLRQLDLELAGRLTDDEFYGTNETFSIKAGYRPVDSLLLRGTVGTSFRAPTLRENFFLGQSGFQTLADPCAVPSVALSGALGANTYNRADDPRSDTLLANCVAQGVNPESFMAGTLGQSSVEVTRGGSFDLEPENSDSYTVGFSFEQPFTDFVDLELGATYYDINIQNTIIEPSTTFIINDCLVNNPNLQSAFCSRITRDFADATTPGRLSDIDSGFINRSEETARGIDFSLDIGKDDVSIFGKNVDFGLSTRFNRLLERKTVDVVAGSPPDIEEFLGDFGFSKWRGFVTGTADVDKFRFAWTTRFQSSVEADFEDLDVQELTDFENGNVVTCGGPANNDVLCRTVYQADDYFVHNASVSYREDTWSVIVGVNNVFNTDPELVDPFEVFSVNNVPIGNGYDLNGREYFIRATKAFR